MAFSTDTLTNIGAQLLASATISDRLIIVGCDADNTVLTTIQAQEITSRPSIPVSTTTVVTNLSVTTNHVQCRAYYHAGDVTGGNVNTFYLYGYLESDPSTQYVVYVLSSSQTTHIPTTSDTYNELEILFDIVYSISTNAVAFATQATYASQVEVDGLRDTIVTTHTFGDPTSGDTQSILGHKTFVNGIHIPDTEYFCIGSDDTTKMLGDDTFFSISHQLPDETHHTFFYVGSGATENINIILTPNGTGKIKLQGITETNNDIELGGDLVFLNDTELYKDFYIRQPHANRIFSLEIPDYIDPPSGDIREYGSSIFISEDSSIGTTLRISLENGNDGIVIIDNNTIIYGGLTCSSILVNTDLYVSQSLHTDSCNTRYINMNGGSTGGNFVIHNVDTGSDSVRRSSDLEVTLSSVPLGSKNYFSLGSNLTLKANGGIVGTQPSVSGTTLIVPIGGIVMHYKNDSVDVSIGDMITINNATTSPYRKVAKNNAGTWQAGDKELPNGKYAFLHEASGTGIPVLLQRVE